MRRTEREREVGEKNEGSDKRSIKKHSKYGYIDAIKVNKSD